MIGEQDIARAAQVIRNGGVVVYPTETAYGLGVDATNQVALAKLYSLKAMPFTKPTHICVANIDEANKYATVGKRARALAKAFLPGPLTLVLPTKSELPNILINQTDRSIGIRIPSHPVALSFLNLAGVPITATSANLHSKPTTYLIEDVEQSFGTKFAKIDYVLDAGELPRTAPSAVLSLMTKDPKILRQGPISIEEIEKVLEILDL